MAVSQKSVATKTSQTRKFKAHEQHLVNTVLRQAGSLWKSILEGVMNSVDAGATKCEVTLSEHMVVIHDDGRGFQTSKEIEQHFETFGTPHEEGDATYGEFRMGRGQLFAFGANDWQTGKFHMLVDVKAKGLTYDLYDIKPVPGCRVEIRLYKKLFPSELASAEDELKKFVRYVSIPVTLNGKVISEAPEQTKNWDHVNPDFYLKLQDRGELRIYNLGVFVCAVPASTVGSGGILVSRQKLKLNFARNDVMRGGAEKCPIWAKIEPLLKTQVKEKITRKEALTSDARESLAKDLVAGEEVKNAGSLALFSSTTGRHYSLRQLLGVRQQFKVVCRGQKYDERADRVMQMKLAFVFDEATVALFGVESLKPFLARLDDLAISLGLLNPQSTTKFSNWTVKRLDAMAGELETSFLLIEDEKLTPWETAVLETTRNAAQYLPSYLDVQGARRIILGESKSYAGWTDGLTYIAIDRKFLKRFHNSLELWTQLGFLLTHEYCHDGPTHTKHQHTPEFYEHFHNAVRGLHHNTGSIGFFVDRAILGFSERARKVDAKLSKFMMKRLDLADNTVRWNAHLRTKTAELEEQQQQARGKAASA